MANFCKKCGRPLENGRCPVCDPVSNNPYAQPAPPVDFNQGSGSAFLGGLEQDFRSLSQSRDVFRLIPAAAFGVLALVTLVSLVMSFLPEIPYGLAMAVSWIQLLAFLAVGAGAVGLFKGDSQSGAGLLQGVICALLGFSGVLNLLGFSGVLNLLGFSGVLNLLGMVTYGFTTYNFLPPCLFLLMLGLGTAEKDRIWRVRYYVGAGLLALSMLLSIFTNSNVLHYIFLLYCTLCAGISFVRSAAKTAA